MDPVHWGTPPTFLVSESGAYARLEGLQVEGRRKAFMYLSGAQLLEECERLTVESKRLASLGIYDRARPLAQVADELEAYIAVRRANR